MQLASSIYLPGASEFGGGLVYRKSERGKAITNRPFNAVASGTRLSENAIIEIEGISSQRMKWTQDTFILGRGRIHVSDVHKIGRS